MIAAKWGIGRAEMEEFALASHQRAVAAIDAGDFDAEIEPYGDVRADECPRRETSLERMAALATLRPAADGGVITAALSSQIADGAAALLIASEQAVAEHGLRPRARIRHLSARGDDPVLMLTAPIAATEHALRKAGHDAGRHRPDRDQRGVRARRARLAAGDRRRSEPGERQRRRNRARPSARGDRRPADDDTAARPRSGPAAGYGLQTMCEGGGQANVTIIERLG